jgi:hypothetical protein
VRNAQEALKALEQQTAALTEEEREIRSQSSIVQKKLVRLTAVALKNDSLTNYRRQDVLNQRKKAIHDAHSRLEKQKKSKSMSAVTDRVLSSDVLPVIAMAEEKLTDLLGQPSMDEKRSELKKKLYKVTKNRVRLVEEYIVSSQA